MTGALADTLHSGYSDYIASTEYGTVAVANTRPKPYPFGCSVSVSGALFDPVFDPRPIDPFHTPDYTGTVYDSGAGWDANHHNVPPDAWIDI